MAEADAGTVAIAVPAEVDARSAVGPGGGPCLGGAEAGAGTAAIAVPAEVDAGSAEGLASSRRPVLGQANQEQTKTLRTFYPLAPHVCL